MNTRLIKHTLPAAISLSLAACLGGGSEVVITGIGGSGLIATGTVTGFGSVFVNGVEFETSSTVFDIDGAPGTQADLAIGMVVQVSGSVNADGVTGIATEIRFDDQLQGPVNNIIPAVSTPDVENRSFEVFGTTVHINRTDTVFDISGVITGTTFDFDTISDGNNVEISGFFNAAGELVATRVELKNVTFDAASIIELRGTIAGLANTTFTLNGINIDASVAVINDLPNGLADGALVEVKGTYDTSSNTVTATRVEGRTSGVDDTADKISVEGIVTNYVDDSDFMLNGINVDASSATLAPTTLVIRDGARIEVEGPVNGGVLQALTVELRGGDALVYATVSFVDQVTGNFEVLPVATQNAIPVTVTTATETEDPVAVNDFVRVRGFENDNSGITATRVEVRSSSDDVIVRGNLQGFAADTNVTLLGVTFGVDYSSGSGETEFRNTNDAPINQITFESLAPVGTLIKVKDKEGSSNTAPNEIADEIEIELP